MDHEKVKALFLHLIDDGTAQERADRVTWIQEAFDDAMNEHPDLEWDGKACWYD